MVSEGNLNGDLRRAAAATNGTATSEQQEREEEEDPDIVIFPPTNPPSTTASTGTPGAARPPHRPHFAPQQQQLYQHHHDELMGPLLRRKKVVSMPIGMGGDFFVSTTTTDAGGPHRQLFTLDEAAADYTSEPFAAAGAGAAPPSAGATGSRLIRSKQRSLGHHPLVAAAVGGAAALPARRPSSPSSGHLVRQKTPPATTAAPPHAHRQRQGSGAGGFVAGMVRRKQVSLDLLGPNDFFAAPLPPPVELPSEEDQEAGEVAKPSEEEEEVVSAGEGLSAVPEDSELAQRQARLFRPLRFAPRMVPKRRSGGGGGGHGGGGAAAAAAAAEEAAPPAAAAPAMIDPNARDAFLRYTRNAQELKLLMLGLQKKLETERDPARRAHLIREVDALLKTHADMKADEALLRTAIMPEEEKEKGVSDRKATTQHTEPTTAAEEDDDDDDEQDERAKLQPDDDDLAFLDVDDGIVRATKSDRIKAAVCFAVMLALTVVVATWETHLDEHSHIFAVVGLACVTYCPGDLVTKDFFSGHNHFEPDQVIELILHLDANPLATGDDHIAIEIVGSETGHVKARGEYGPVDIDHRLSFDERFLVDFADPEEHHVINVNSTNPDIELSFTLDAHVRRPITDSSVIVAACIMVAVYFFILIEVIHRTLVAIFGSMVALMFLYVMTDGHTESIGQIMLHLEWSTLGLLFGMMIIVGELSHTGIFEWLSVRLLVASKGSFKRLLVLLCVLTAVASAFLDNVTTMLLVAPVTIDMCNILGVDPRPYLISEVLLSNIGGTATLIGDPPNIIIGSSFAEIGFVDFIINILPCIFLFCIPVSLMLVLFIYRFYLTSTTMKVLDARELKKTYPIYDQPRLLIAGTVAFFVIVMFFLHPVHHKDTAWIALLGAFVTIAFTNPHDVQDALRNHVEWDTLLFFAGLFVLVEVCAEMGLLAKIGELLANYIKAQDEGSQLPTAITLLLWVSAITSAFLDNIPYTATMIPVIEILADELPDTLPLTTLAWALSFGACLGGNGTLLGASANIVTAGISTNKGFEISFLNFLYPGMLAMTATVAISNLYMLVVYVWA